MTIDIDHSPRTSETVGDICRELKIANKRLKRIQEYTAWCASLAQLALLLAVLGIVSWFLF